MAARVRVELISAGLEDLLTSAGVHELISGLCEQTKQRAESRAVMVQRGSEREPMPYETSVEIVGDRVSGIVAADHPAGLAAEAKYATLASSL